MRRKEGKERKFTPNFSRCGGDDINSLLQGIEGGRERRAANEQKGFEARRGHIFGEKVDVIVRLLRQLTGRF